LRPLPAGIAAAAATAGVAHTVPALAPIVPPVAAVLGVPRRQEGRGVAITFDDGPHPIGTLRVLETLREHDAPATFFLAGEQVERRPALAAEIVAAGHRVELHCHRHRNQLRLTPRSLIEDAERGRAAIEEATGQAVRDYRPPYGIFSAAGLRAIRGRGWRPVLWSRWGKDWRASATPESIVKRTTSAARDGDVILLHDADYYSAGGSWIRTAAALPVMLEKLAGQGLRPVSLRR
jgi:peptidoglycan/xylan/chitin deacetylase (PgdA/CDA1 family)